MKKFIAIAILALFTTACTQATYHEGMMQGKSMCEQCPCCQDMMQDGTMMKNGNQCPMMNGNNMECECCQGMMGNGMMKNMKPKKPATTKNNSHTQHH